MDLMPSASPVDANPTDVVIDLETPIPDEPSRMKQKIQQLELELSTTKSRLQSLESIHMAMVENYNGNSNAIIESPSNLPHPVAFIPPPPPPPPAPAPPQNKENVLDIIRKNKSKSSANKKAAGVIDMTEVLKDMKTVKLRHVARSPSGRPIRQPPTNSDDLAAVFNRALRMKFSSQGSSTPNRAEKEPSEFTGWTPQNESSLDLIS